MEQFVVPVRDLYEARRVIDMLTRYDEFQLAHNIKPDYTNAGGLQTWDGDEWVDWESADGDTIDTIELHGDYEPDLTTPEMRVALTQVFDDGQQNWDRCVGWPPHGTVSHVDNKTPVEDCYKAVRPFTNHQGSSE